jgi:hypothetical protein
MSTLLCVLILLFTTDASIEIPLSDMRGVHIEGVMLPDSLFPTDPVRRLINDSNDDLAHYAIRKWIEQQPMAAIHKNLSYRKEFGPGFVVGSVDAAALLTAKMVLCDGLKPKDSFLTKHELTLVFFAGDIDVFILKPVKREGNRIIVDYEIPDRLDKRPMVMPHFALIPLGKLPAGKYEVVIPEHKWVCSSFEFQVKEQ